MVSLVKVTGDPSSRVVVIIWVEVMVVSWGVSSSADEVGLGELLVVGESLSSLFALEEGGLLDDVGAGVDVAGLDVTGGFVGVDDVTGGGVDSSGSSEVGFAGADDDVCSGGAASVVSGSVFASSSCLRWIPFTLRPAMLTPAKVASATDIAESPKTRNLSAELSCIVTDFVAVARQINAAMAPLVWYERRSRLRNGIPVAASLLCYYSRSVSSFRGSPRLSRRFRMKSDQAARQAVPNTAK
jgi:hypothetical protein